MLVQFECGCIGFPPDKDGMAWIIKSCDNEFFEKTSMCNRSLVNYNNGETNIKSFVPIEKAEVEDIFKEMQQLIMDGHDFRQIQNLLCGNLKMRVKNLEYRAKIS